MKMKIHPFGVPVSRIIEVPELQELLKNDEFDVLDGQMIDVRNLSDLDKHRLKTLSKEERWLNK